MDSMPGLFVKVLDSRTGLPVSGKRVSIRTYVGPFREAVDWDEYTNKDGIAQFMFIDAGRKEILVDGVPKLEVEHGYNAGHEDIVVNL